MYDEYGTTITASNWGAITGSDTGYRIIVTSAAGTETTITEPSKATKSEKRISPGLYFKYVKSKLSPLEINDLKSRLTRLQELTKDAFELGQQALYEEYAKMMAIIVREQEASVCGFDRWISVKDIDKFKSMVKEDGDSRSPVHFSKLEDFPRSIPSKVKDKIKEVQKKHLFDQIWVLYLSYKDEPLKTNKEKIREKDPIAFGQFAYAKDKYYYITDWVDEYCDLTLEKFLDKFDPEYIMNRTPEIDEAFVERIKKEVLARQQRLDGTKASNYKDLMKEEDLEKLKEEIRSEMKKKPWWKFWT